MIIRELVTKLTFKVDNAKLIRFNKNLKATIAIAKKVTKEITKITGSVRKLNAVKPKINIKVNKGGLGKFDKDLKKIKKTVRDIEKGITKVLRSARKINITTPKLDVKVNTTGLERLNRKLAVTKRLSRETIGELRDFSRSVRNVGIGITALVTLPLTLLGIKALKTSANLEQAKIALEVFLGSEEKALEKQKELIKFASETPFQVLGIQETAGQLLGAGIEADKLIPTLNALGNAAKGDSAIFQRLVLNLAQVKTQGKLTGRDLRDFLVGQVPLTKLLAKGLNTTEAAIASMTSKGQISFADVEKAFFDASKEGGFFFDLMKKQSKTLTGRFSNLMDAITVFLAEFGDAIDVAFNLKENITKLAVFIGKLTARFKSLNPKIKTLIIHFITFIALIGPLITMLGIAALAFFSLKIAAGFLAVTMTVLAATMGMIIFVIAAIGIAIHILIDDFNTWRSGGESVIGSLLGSFERFKNVLSKIFNTIKNVFTTFFTAITDNSKENWKAFFDAIITTAKLFVKTIKLVLFDKVGELLDKLGLKILNTFTRNFGRVKNLFGFKQRNFVEQQTPQEKNAELTAEALKNDFDVSVLRQQALGQGQNVQDIKIDPVINLTLPIGTPEEQKKIVSEDARKMVREELQTIIGNTISANPRNEQ